jgi:oxalate decarboxylase/phosphoglucose isomerase-like protein (cupin superfamily)
VFTPKSLGLLEGAYPEQPVKLLHNLVSHDLLTKDALVALASQLPTKSVEYNPGRLPIGIDPHNVPPPRLDIPEAIRTIEDNGYWMVIKNIEQNARYRELLNDTLAEIAPLAAARTGAMLGQEGFIFLSSPGSVTPFHFDPEHNILLQVRGEKTMTVFPANDEALVSPQAHEAFHMGEHHRNQPYNDTFAAKGNPVALSPGEAIYVPVKAPHWVQNGAQVSVSLSITWRSEWSYAEADARAFNRLIRRTGIDPKSPGRYPVRNTGKAMAYRVVRRMQGMIGS